MGEIIEWRRWKYVGPVLRRRGAPTEVSLGWAPEGKRRPGRPKQTWRQAMLKRLTTSGVKSWNKAAELAKRQTEVARDGQADEFEATCHEAFCKLSQVSQKGSGTSFADALFCLYCGSEFHILQQSSVIMKILVNMSLLVTLTSRPKHYDVDDDCLPSEKKHPFCFPKTVPGIQ